jgi:ABC-type branched-subunit amino acid transport system substrate-binding protein
VAALLACATTLARAADIVIGQTAGFTGPAAQSVKEVTDGARLYIDAVNARGGVNGNRIKLVSLDDRFDPKVSARNAAALVADGAVALFLTRGTPHTQAVLPVARANGIPVIAPSTGAMVFSNPVDPLVFNVRAPYQLESERAIAYLLSTGADRIGVIQVDDSFGADAAAGAQIAFDKAGVKPLFEDKVNRDKPDFAMSLRHVVEMSPQAVMIVANADAVLLAAREIGQTRTRCQLVTLSNNSASSFGPDIAKLAPNAIVSQVYPNERTLSIPMIVEATKLLAKKDPGAQLSAANVEGFAAAEVLVEGLRRAGHSPTPASIIAGLNSMNRFDLGGMEISYGSGKHSGSQFTDLAIVRSDGKLVR